MVNLYLVEKLIQLRNQDVERSAQEFWKFQSVNRKPLAPPVQLSTQTMPVCCAV